MLSFSLNTAAFARALSVVTPVVSNSPVVPILDGVLIYIANGVMRLKCSDLATTLTTSLPVETKESVLLCVPAKQVEKTLRGFPNAPVTCSYDPQTYAFEMVCGKSTYKVVGQNPADFIKPSVLGENPVSLTAPADALHHAFSAALTCVSADELRPALTAVLVESGADEVRLAATDGNRIMYYAADAQWQASGEFKRLLPGKAVGLLLPLLAAKKDEAVTLSFDGGHAFAEGFTARLVDENYPDYRSVFPTAHLSQLLIDRDEVLPAAKRLLAYSPEKGNMAKMGTLAMDDSGAVTLRAEDFDFSNEGEESATGEYDGDPLTIGFNLSMLSQVIALWPAGRIRIQFSTPKRAALFTHPSEPAITALLMPMMLNSPV